MHIIDHSGLILDILADLNWLSDQDVSMNVDSFLKQELKAKNEFLLINAHSLLTITDELLSRLNSYKGIIVFYQSTRPSLIEDLIDKNKMIIGVFPWPFQNEVKSLVMNQLQWLKTNLEEKKNLKSQMIKFSEEIDFLVKSAETEMLKAKKIHESVVPKRIEEFKGITLMSKYAVGSGSGSEYFDLIRGTHQSHLIVIHTNSYLASSSLMGLLNKYKGETQGIDFELYMREAEIEIEAINANKKKPVLVQMLLLTLNHLDLSCYGYSFGEFDLISRMTPVQLPALDSFVLRNKSSAYFEFQLVREEKVVVFSPGFIFNWKEQLISHSLRDFVKDKVDSDSGDLLVELFFQLKKKLDDDFLAKDATAIVMEVKRYAIQKV